MDWAMKSNLKELDLTKKFQNKSSTDHLVYFEDVPFFKVKDIRIIGFLSQWGIFTKAQGNRVKSRVK